MSRSPSGRHCIAARFILRKGVFPNVLLREHPSSTAGYRESDLADLEASRAVLDAMTEESGVRLEVRKVDGGATANNLLMQLHADILGVPVVRPVVTETTALGAAYAAGLARGVWADLDALRAQWKADRQWEPQWSDDQGEAAFRGWRRRLIAPSAGWIVPDEERLHRGIARRLKPARQRAFARVRM